MKRRGAFIKVHLDVTKTIRGNAITADLAGGAVSSSQDFLQLYRWMRCARSVDEIKSELIARGEMSAHLSAPLLNVLSLVGPVGMCDLDIAWKASPQPLSHQHVVETIGSNPADQSVMVVELPV